MITTMILSEVRFHIAQKRECDIAEEKPKKQVSSAGRSDQVRMTGSATTRPRKALFSLHVSCQIRCSHATERAVRDGGEYNMGGIMDDGC